jgi:RHS repeat-associated protein
MSNVKMFVPLVLAALGFVARPSMAAVPVSEVQYFHLDGLGSVRAMSDKSGQLITSETRAYLPFGEQWCGGPACPPPAPTSQPKRFTGKERDTETGLDYFGARYYGARLARFTTVDPATNTQESLADPQRWNRYAYSLNSPYRYIDPDGRLPRKIVTAAERELFSRARKDAVKEAWQMERRILKEQGPEKMTIVLTKAEQDELIKTGKVTGWYGHHINNVADHDLAMARDPNNIKFVKGIKAHLEEHGNNFGNATSGPLMERSRILEGLMGLLPGMWLQDLVDAGGAVAETAGDYVDGLGRQGLDRVLKDRERAYDLRNNTPQQ